mmetsp:Transcript_18835/g.50092  ORF Transcript_18835/g.50092 Transcript_18835/m.50092 type:complete len:559 (-) Transcript_18835:402-2078(-)
MWLGLLGFQELAVAAVECRDSWQGCSCNCSLAMSLGIPLLQPPIPESPEVQATCLHDHLSDHLLRVDQGALRQLLEEAARRQDVARGRACGVHVRVELPRGALHAEQREDSPRERRIEVHVVAADEVEALQARVGELQEALVPDISPGVTENRRQLLLEGLWALATSRIWALRKGELGSLRVVCVQNRYRDSSEGLNLLRGQGHGQACIQHHQFELRRPWCHQRDHPLQQRREPHRRPPAARRRLVAGAAALARWGPRGRRRGGRARRPPTPVRIAQAQEDVAWVKITMHKLVLEEHSHVARDALRRNLAGNFLRDLEMPQDALKPRLGPGAAALGIRAAEDPRELLPLFPRKDQQIWGGVQRCREADDCVVVRKVGLESPQVVGLNLEVGLHLHLVAKELCCPSQAIHPQDGVALGEPSSLEEPGEVALEERSDARPHALHSNGSAILQLAKVYLGNAAAGMSLRLQRPDPHAGRVQLPDDLPGGHARGPAGGDLLVQAAEGYANGVREDVSSGGEPLRQLHKAGATTLQLGGDDRPESVWVPKPQRPEQTQRGQEE